MNWLPTEKEVRLPEDKRVVNRLPDDKRLQFVPRDRRPPFTPRLALRVAIVGSLALAMFAIIFFRLWFLQVLSGDRYLAQASVNRVRNVTTPAPRGRMVDRNGDVLVDSQRVIGVQIAPPDLPAPLQSATLGHPPAKDAALFDRLAVVLGMPTDRKPCPVAGHGVLSLSPIGCQVTQQYALLPYANVMIAKDVPADVLYYLQERQDQFPGVNIQPVWLRTYPLHDLASQLFGTIGPISPTEVKEKRYKGLPENDVIGQSGLEAAYDQYLHGQDGADRVQVNSLGRFTGYLSQQNPVAGHDLRLSLDVGLQNAGQQALQQSINTNSSSNGGAFVALNPQDGQVYAMGSLPTFDPNIFTKPISQSAYQQLTNPSAGFPLLNRAIQSAGPTGSTFKPITATAALQSGAWTPSETFDDTGEFCQGGLCRHNAGGGSNGVLDMVNAIRVSDDVFFYNLGSLTNANAITHPNGGALQQWAHLYGVGRKTGIDLAGEVSGNLPSPSWRAKIDAVEKQCEQTHHVPSCGIADGRQWSAGDNVNLAVGQGDVQVTPLQLAVAYSAIANGGNVVRPHIGADVQQPDGTVLQRIDPPPVRHLNIDQTTLDTIREGMHEAAQSGGGTSDDVMGSFPQQVYGKTGTAQYNGQQDYSWYSCFVPAWATNKPIEVVVWVEQGGFGDTAAAPVARQILSQWFSGNRGSYVAGNSKTL